MTARRLLGGSRLIEISTQHEIFSVFFTEDGKQVVSGGEEGVLRRWRVDVGQEVGEPIRTEGAEIYAAALSPDRERLVCGLRRLDLNDGETDAIVWDVQTHEKVFDVHGHENTVFSVDISPDSMQFATGGYDRLVFIWSMHTGKRLVGPLEHDDIVIMVRFSPDGDRLATATGTSDDEDPKSICIYDSENGQQLLEIPCCQFSQNSSSPLAWSTDGLQLFAASSGEVKCFDTSSGTLLSKWSIPDESTASIILSRNQKFAVVVASKSLTFWDTSTGYMQIGSEIEHTSNVWSIALSPSDDCIVTGEENGKVTLRSLRDILPSSYLTVNVSNAIH
ncbi:WD40-repeat-containing domain protein [Boletus reticuloceps]|uniref:WD40-repeat-containing domain protein n=1 Tax=Boletus reticuloceps TaxID=495285 RepID=A0A8I2YCW2_9AGAM|nr:WD40-repeat-containing domain protein [Boletus reticuloceps]